MAGIIKTTKPFGRGPGHYCVGELNYERANKEITLGATTVVLPAGTLLGKLTAGGNYVKFDPAASTGAQTFAGILWSDAPISTGTQRNVATTREATVNVHALIDYDGVLSTPQKAALIAAAEAMSIILLP